MSDTAQKITHDFTFDDDSVRTRDFVTQLDAQNVHPVLIFGAYNCGKTLFLCSMLDHASRADVGGMAYVPNDGYVFPPDYPLSTERNRAADELFDIVRKFGAGHLPENTNRERPIFALASLKSAKVKPNGDKESVKFAFMEGNGEWNGYDDRVLAYKESTPEVRAVIREFKKPISSIFVVPSRGGVGAGESTEDKGSQESAFSSAQASLRLYDKFRPMDLRGSDNFLLLVTKWDQNWAANGGTLQEGFYSPKAEEIERRLGEASMLPIFRNLPGTSNEGDKKAIMVYSAALVKKVPSGAQIVRSDDRAQVTIADFNHKVWTWLYGNATEALFKRRRSLGQSEADDPSLGEKARDFLFGFR